MTGMMLMAVSDGKGGMRHELRPCADKQPRKKGRCSPDPLKARNSNGEELKSFLERIERIEAEIADLTADKSEVFSELKGRGYSDLVVRAMLAERRKDSAEVQEFNATLELYKHAVGWGDDRA